jgi:hypothetical protein
MCCDCAAGAQDVSSLHTQHVHLRVAAHCCHKQPTQYVSQVSTTCCAPTQVQCGSHNRTHNVQVVDLPPDNNGDMDDWDLRIRQEARLYDEDVREAWHTDMAFEWSKPAAGHFPEHDFRDEMVACAPPSCCLLQCHLPVCALQVSCGFCVTCLRTHHGVGRRGRELQYARACSC